jgi:23S rRNA pseudouridine2605 synthase
MKKERIQKVLARCGVASRREIERWIVDGRVKVNKELAQLGQVIGSDDKVEVQSNGRRWRRVKLNAEQVDRFIIYNKPEGEIVTRNDPGDRPTVFAALPQLDNGRWINIGRLDINTSGLLLFTNNGEFAHQLMHPSTHLEREYAVRVFGKVTETTVKNLVDGVMLEDGRARFEDVVAAESQGANRWFHVVLMEGRNRLVRRLWESQDCQVSRLKRVRFGPVFLPSGLRQGRCSEITGSLKQQLIEQCQSNQKE